MHLPWMTKGKNFLNKTLPMRLKGTSITTTSYTSTRPTKRDRPEVMLKQAVAQWNVDFINKSSAEHIYK